MLKRNKANHPNKYCVYSFDKHPPVSQSVWSTKHRFVFSQVIDLYLLIYGKTKLSYSMSHRQVLMDMQCKDITMITDKKNKS